MSEINIEDYQEVVNGHIKALKQIEIMKEALLEIAFLDDRKYATISQDALDKIKEFED